MKVISIINASGMAVTTVLNVLMGHWMTALACLAATLFAVHVVILQHPLSSPPSPGPPWTPRPDSKPRNASQPSERRFPGNRVDIMAETVFTKCMTNHTNHSNCEDHGNQAKVQDPFTGEWVWVCEGCGADCGTAPAPVAR